MPSTSNNILNETKSSDPSKKINNQNYEVKNDLKYIAASSSTPKDFFTLILNFKHQRRKRQRVKFLIFKQKYFLFF